MTAAELNQVIAAWVQAVGSIAAIVAAFLLVRMDHDHDRRLREEDRAESAAERQLRKRAAAHRICNFAIETKQQIIAIERLIEQTKSNPQALSSPTLAHLQMKAGLTAPFVEDGYLLGPGVSREYSQLFGLVAVHNITLDNMMLQSRDDEFSPAFVGSLGKVVSSGRVRERAIALEQMLAPLYNSPEG